MLSLKGCGQVKPLSDWVNEVPALISVNQGNNCSSNIAIPNSRTIRVDFRMQRKLTFPFRKASHIVCKPTRKIQLGEVNYIWKSSRINLGFQVNDWSKSVLILGDDWISESKQITFLLASSFCWRWGMSTLVRCLCALVWINDRDAVGLSCGWMATTKLIPLTAVQVMPGTNSMNWNHAVQVTREWSRLQTEDCCTARIKSSLVTSSFSTVATYCGIGAPALPSRSVVRPVRQNFLRATSRCTTMTWPQQGLVVPGGAGSTWEHHNELSWQQRIGSMLFTDCKIQFLYCSWLMGLSEESIWPNLWTQASLIRCSSSPEILMSGRAFIWFRPMRTNLSNVIRPPSFKSMSSKSSSSKSGLLTFSSLVPSEPSQHKSRPPMV